MTATSLFNHRVPWTEQLADLPGLPDHADEYNRRKNPTTRASADPLGKAGLPDAREDLNNLVIDLCRRLRAAGGRPIKGRRLVERLDLRDTRALRHLVAYAHVHHRLRQIVGTPGSGYFWGDCVDGAYHDAARHARRMGLCHLFLASLYAKRPAAIEAAQMCLQFAGEIEPTAKGSDELSGWLAAEQVDPAAILEALVERFRSTEAGRLALRQVAAKHADVLVSAEILDQVEQRLKESLSRLQAARQPAT